MEEDPLSRGASLRSSCHQQSHPGAIATATRPRSMLEPQALLLPPNKDAPSVPYIRVACEADDCGRLLRVRARAEFACSMPETVDACLPRLKMHQGWIAGLRNVKVVAAPSGRLPVVGDGARPLLSPPWHAGAPARGAARRQAAAAGGAVRALPQVSFVAAAREL